MTNFSSLGLELAGLLSARLCHDLAGPVGAAENGAELLSEGGAEGMEDARELISNCAGQAVRRLRFFRLAYGSHHGSMDWSGAMQTGARCWPIPRSSSPGKVPMTAPWIRSLPAPEHWS